MKRYIKSDSSVPSLSSRATIKDWHGKKLHNYSVNYSGNSPETFSFSLRGLHPYDDAEYAWCRANVGEPIAKFYLNGKLLDTLQFEYDEDDFESFAEYIDEFVDRCIAKLEDLNKDIQPKIMHF